MVLQPSSARRPAMTDVARLAGVSHQTVSRVLNDADKVSAETRQRVLAAIQELGYQRNESARALATRRSNLIGIITIPDDTYGPSQSMFGVELAAKDAGYLVSVAAISDFGENTLRDSINVFLSLGVAAIVLIAPVIQVAADLADLNVPVPLVAITSSWPKTDQKTARIGIDQRWGAAKAVTWLVETGARSVAHISGPADWFDAVEREIGWRKALNKAKLPADRIERGDWSAESGHKAMRKLLESGLPDAIFVGNDLMAMGAITAISEAGYRVPQDTRVIGFDDVPGANYYLPPLTTVAQDFRAVGHEAMAAITSMLGGEVGKSRLIEPHLVIRRSG